MRGWRAIQTLAVWATALMLGCSPTLGQTTLNVTNTSQESLFSPNPNLSASNFFDERSMTHLAACKRKPNLLVVIVAAHEPVDVGTDLSLGELGQLASRIGLRGKQKLFGFYFSQFGYAVSVDISEPILGDCKQTIRIRVDMVLTERRIEIGREVREHACLFPLILEHYSRYAAFDDDVVTRFVEWAKVAISTRPMLPLQGNARSIEKDRKRIRDFAEAIVEQGLPAFRAERNSAAEVVDTQSELQRLEEGCSTRA